jgi:hypothetical protein
MTSTTALAAAASAGKVVCSHLCVDIVHTTYYIYAQILGMQTVTCFPCVDKQLDTALHQENEADSKVGMYSVSITLWKDHMVWLL